MKAHELRSKSKAELQSQVSIADNDALLCNLRCHVWELTSFFASPLQLKDLKTELGALRVAKVTGGAPNKLSKM